MAQAKEDKEEPLREDRRLLGRLLGDVISEQVGEATREQIEAIRQTAVRFRRAESDPSMQARSRQARSRSMQDRPLFPGTGPRRH